MFRLPLILRRRARWILAAAAMAVPGVAGASLLANYSIVTLGLTDPLHMGLGGTFRSLVEDINATGRVTGTSSRYINDVWGVNTNVSAWVYDGLQTVRIGLYDLAHTDPVTGGQTSVPELLNAAGQVAGRSVKLDGLQTGQSAWIYSAGQTTRLGFTDAEHTSSTAVQVSGVLSLNARGDVAGYSNRYQSSTHTGQSIWLYSNGNTRRVGFYDAEHTTSTDRAWSFLVAANDAGQHIGRSDRYLGTDWFGQSGWLADASGQVRLGLYDSNHVRSDGYQMTDPLAINDAGMVVGYSAAFLGDDDLGNDAWVYQGGVTTVIGLNDPDHTGPGGYRDSVAKAVTPSGLVIGDSVRFVADELGYSQWTYDGVTTTRIGLFDAEHTSAANAQSSSILAITPNNVIAGESFRYDGATPAGMSVWIHKNGITQRMGLIDAEHTLPDNSRMSFLGNLNDAGQASGQSVNAVGTFQTGVSTWFFDGTTTTRINLTDAQHTSSTGIRNSRDLLMNNSGQVVGISDRFSGSLEIGSSAWFYDGTTTPLVFSVATDGTARTLPDHLTEAGEVIGLYDKYTGATLDDTLPFYWSEADGFHELSDVVNGGTAAAGWASLSDIRRVVQDPTGLRYVIGQGTRTDGSTMGYLLAVHGGGAWSNPSGGTWQTGTNWTLGDAPSHRDDAVFSIASTYTVTLGSDSTSHDLNIANGEVTIDLAGNRLLASNTLRVQSGAKLKFSNGAVRSASLSIAATGQLDVTDAPLILDYIGANPLSEVTALVASGRNGGAWNGFGIVSSLAIGDSSKSVAVVDNGVAGHLAFRGEPVGPTSLIVQLTYNGDANLDGLVNLRDLILLANAWQMAGTWVNGDFDYNGVVNAVDLGLLALNWQAAIPLAQVAADLGLPSPVPEPAMLGLALPALLLRRRR